MSRFAITLTLVLTMVGGVVIEEQQADACGVKLWIKNVRQRARVKQREKAEPVNAEERAVVARREARVPVAAGPREVITPHVIEPKPAEKPVVVQEKVTPTAIEPEHVATAPTPPVEQPKPPPVTPKPVTPKPAPATSATLDQEVYFTTGSASVGNRNALATATRWLTSNPDVHATVEGYADPTGTPDGNMALSQQRAEAVRDYLVSQGIDGSRLEVQSFGDTKLKYGRTDGRNRRVAIEAKK